MAAEPMSVRTEELLANAGWLRALAASLVSDRASADDLVQDTWVAALRHPPDPGRPLRPWLARVVQNLARNRRRGDVRRSDREASLRPTGEPISPAKIAEEVEAQRLLADAVLKLEEPLRTTVVLRYFRGMNASEIATAQKVPAGTVRWRLKRAIELLRIDLDGRFGGDRESWCLAFAALLPREGAVLAATTATTSTVTTGVWIMSTSTKVGIAAVLALFVGVAVWKLSDVEPAKPQELLVAAEAADVIEPPTERQVATAPSRDPRVAATLKAVARATSTVEPERPVASATDDCCITGRVSHGEEPLAGVTVTAQLAWSEDGERTVLHPQIADEGGFIARTDADGRFRIKVPSMKPFALIAHADGFARQAASPCFAGQFASIKITRGAAVAVDVRAHDTNTAGASDVPLAGARVSASATAECTTHPYWMAEVTSDSGGEAQFEGVPAGKIEVHAQVPGFVYTETEVQTHGVEAFRCTLVLLRPSAIEGTVVDRIGRFPIVGARVECNDDGALTDASGFFRLASFTPGASNHSLTATAPGYTPAYRYVKIDASGATKRVDIELDTAEKAHGRVMDPSHGPVAEAWVSCFARIKTEPFLGEIQVESARTGADGRFEFDHLRADIVYRLIVVANGFGAHSLPFGPLLPGSAAADLGDIVLSPPASIAGQIEGSEFRPDDEERLFGDSTRYLVRLRTAEYPEDPWSLLGSTRFDPKGRFLFENLGAGRYRIELVEIGISGASKQERLLATRTVELHAGETMNDFRFSTDGSEITGLVVDASGSPLSGCRVSLQGPSARAERTESATTDESGRFRMLVGTDGPFRLLVEDPRLFCDSKIVDDVHPSDGELSIELATFHSNFAIGGRVVDVSGRAPERVYVAFTDTTTKQRLGRVGMPDESGRFEMKDLRDLPYDLELVDFGQLYRPAKVANVRPSSGDVVLQVERRE